MTKWTKLEKAIHALAQISFLDLRSDATLADAVKLAEDALVAINRDHMLILLDTPEGNLQVRVVSAAGNQAHVQALTPLVKELLNALAEHEGGQPITWSDE